MVTEQIFISDDEGGDRSYPTLSMVVGVTPGSWEARSETEHWDDVPVSQHWDDA
jgi:hypothetical protein